MTMILDGTNGVTYNDTSLQTAAASPYVLKNRIINGGFQVWQRSTSSTGTTGYYTADRWYVTGTANVTISKSANPTSPNGNYFLTWTTSGASTYANIGQCIESVNITDLRSQTVTVSAWVQLGAGTYNGFGLVWNIYTNTSDALSTTTPVTLTTSSGNVVPTGTWQQMFATFVVPSTCVSLSCFLNNNAVQPSGVAVNIADVQLEKGSSITPLEKRLYGQELINCQRYYETNTFDIRTYGSASDVTIPIITFQVSKRATPTITYQASPTYVNASGLTTQNINIQSFGARWTVTSTGGTEVLSSFFATAEL
jgi:hypothetical protein